MSRLVWLLLPAVAVAGTVKIDGHTFTVPDGFTVEKVAGPPLVERPIVANFDDRGRLYVADSSGSNAKVDEQLKNPTHRIVRLEDTNGDGTFDKSVVFADKMMFPQGCLWFRGSVYVAAAPHIWKLTDTNDDGVCDKREVWFDGKTLTGCANDLHGPYLGPDGWLYWTKGAFAKQEHTLPNGKKLTTRAAHIFRARPDGTGIEPVMTGGMDNPVDVAFLPNGERFFTSTFVQHPAGGKRDGIVHAVYGGIYGKDHDVIYDPVHKWTGPETMPIMTHLGPAAPSGLLCYRGNVSTQDLQNNLFCAQFNLRKVSRHILIEKGSTYETLDSDFLVSDNTDFHPTDVIEARDESLLVIDTGGWYKLCCPSSQLVKEDVKGAIYRVKRLVNRLPAVIICDDIPMQIQRECHDAGLKRDKAAMPMLVERLNYEYPLTRRMAAEALGRIGDKSAVPDLLRALDATDVDPTLEHAITYALIEIGDAEGVARRFSGKSSVRAQRTIHTVLDQLGSDRLQNMRVIADMRSPDPVSRARAIWIATRHPEWSEEVMAYLYDELRNKDAGDDLVPLLARFARTADMQKMLADSLADEMANRRYVMRAIQRSGLKEMPPAWATALAAVVRTDTALRSEALVTLRSMPIARGHRQAVEAALSTLIGTGTDPDIRLAALAAWPARLLDLAPETAAFLRESLDRDQPAARRSLAADVLARSELSGAQLQALGGHLRRVSPLELDRVLSAFAVNKEDGVGQSLLVALDHDELRPALRVDGVKERIKQFGPAVQAEAEKLYAKLNKDHAAQMARLDALAKELKPGDVRRGQAVFNSTKASCIACHTIGYVGGKQGPDLTKIGGIRTERDLLESILFPSSSFVRSYEPVIVATKDTKSFSGVVRKDGPDEMVLAIAADKEVRIPRAEIDEVRPGKVSIMPDGLDKQLTPQELADLVAFLKACK